MYKHDDGRPMLGRKLKGKSKRELDYLGLIGPQGRGGEVDPKPERSAPDSSPS